MKRVKLVISGDVQGVFFRHNMEKEAGALNLTGWCRNEPDGTVFAVVEGEDKDIDALVKWAKTGSPLATVENVEITEEKPTGEEKPFEIR